MSGPFCLRRGRMVIPRSVFLLGTLGGKVVLTFACVAPVSLPRFGSPLLVRLSSGDSRFSCFPGPPPPFPSILDRFAL